MVLNAIILPVSIIAIGLYLGTNNLNNNVNSHPMFHYAPWKPKIFYEVNGKGETTIIEEPMTWKDAAKVASILMVANLFIVWLPTKQIPTCEAEAIAFIYTTLIFLGQNFFSAFISLTGLALIYAKKKN